MDALGKAITTENRRIKKEIVNKNALREIGISLPKRKFNIKGKIRELYSKIFGHLEKDKTKIKIPYSELIGDNQEEKIISFAPLLHLENQKKIWLEQDEHFGEIHIWMKETYWKHKGNPFEDLIEELKESGEIKE